MTEKEKRDAGLLYDANYDEALGRELLACKDRCHLYNQIRPSRARERHEAIAALFGRVGENFTIQAPFWCDYGCNIEIGENFFMNHNGVILDGAKVTFGDNVFIAPNCLFSTAGHPLDTAQRNRGLEYAYPITVGDNVWFGAGVIVLPGVTIGSDTVIGAGSLVNRDIPAGVVAAGNPCRVIRPLTAADRDKYPRAAEDL